MGIKDVAYTGAAIYGRVHTVIGTVFASIFAIAMIVSGFYLLIKKPTIHYTTEDKNTSPTQHVMSKTKENLLGVGLIFGALLIIGLMWLMTYFTMKSKPFAAVTGTVDAASDIMNLLN